MVLLNFLGWVLCYCYHMIMHCILFHYIHIFMHSRIVYLINQCECCSLDLVFAHNAIYFLHVTCSCITMHCISLFFSFLSIFFYCFLFSFFLLLNFSDYGTQKSVPFKNPITHRGSCSTSSLPSVLIEFGSMMRTPKRTLLRTFVIG